MELNKETAMRLWNKTFGKSTSANDYAGRKMVKSAYNDRNSEFAWNVDHIFPQSKGGKTNDSNLVICHLLTNDEKADKFPCFTANNQRFEIKKVENHYEIKNLSLKQNTLQDEETDFLDFASGLRLFKKLKREQNKPRFVGSAFIVLENIQNTAIIDFIKNLFDEESISFDVNSNYYSHYNEKITIILKNYDMPLKEDTKALLDKCIILNTYLGNYFLEKGLISGFDIIFRVDSYDTKTNINFLYDKETNKDFLNDIRYIVNENNCSNGCSDFLFINELVAINSDTEEAIKCSYRDYYKYNYIYTDLKANLIKEVNRR